MPLTFDLFVKSPRYKQLTLPPEDQSQDQRDWKNMLREDQKRQYEKYLAQFEPNELRNTETPLHNTQPVLRKPNEKWNEYMKRYRKKSVKCPKCGHQFKSLKRV